MLLDLNMPGMTGFETLKMLRFMLAITELPPIVALTADATAETRESALAVGFSAYVTKPIDTAQLLSTIDRLVGARSALAGGARTPGGDAAAGEAAGPAMAGPAASPARKARPDADRTAWMPRVRRSSRYATLPSGRGWRGPPAGR